MVYQISEKNQILIALFAIVVLCAGKLFKDYLYRGGYVEGLAVIPAANTVLRRPASNTTTVTLFLYLTLGAGLASGNTITVSWPTTISGVTMPTSYSNYTAKKVTDDTVIATLPSGTASSNVVFTTNTVLASGTTLKISMADVSISSGITDIGFNFTTATTSESTAVVTPITILRAGGVDALPGSTSAQEIRDAIASINTRLGDTPNAPGTLEQTNLLKARSALVNVLAYTYGTIKEAGKVFDSEALVEAQKTAIEFIKKEKTRTESNAKSLSQDNTNKRRMAQVNTYYTRNYEANTEVMKNIIYVSVALIVLALLRNKELIPASISTLGVILVLTMGGIVIGTQVFDIMRRNDHEFDKYDWNFNEDDMNNKFIQPSADSSKPMEFGFGGACYGPGCCDVGTTWDPVRGVCASSVGTLSSQGSSAVWANGTGTLTITMRISQALVAGTSGDSIKIILPAGVFTTTTGAIIASSAIASSVTKTAQEIASEISLPVASDVALTSGFATVIITITGITVSPSADRTSYQNVAVATTKEPNKILLRISGLQTA